VIHGMMNYYVTNKTQELAKELDPNVHKLIKYRCLNDRKI